MVSYTHSALSQKNQAVFFFFPGFHIIIINKASAIGI